MLGKHVLKPWSATQASVTLSSGEAEFNGFVRGAGQGLGFQALLKDLGLELPLRVWTDSSAAIGICSRQGLGKLRHLDTHTLWVQQTVRNRRIELKKVLGTENPADLLTKHTCPGEKLRQLVALYGCVYKGGRADSAPQLREGASSKFTLADGGLQVVVEDGGTPSPSWMPHTAMSKAKLDEEYPSIEGVQEDILQDHDNDIDPMLEHGYALAREIQAQMDSHGRTRREKFETFKEAVSSMEEHTSVVTAAQLKDMMTTGGATSEKLNGPGVEIRNLEWC